MAVGSSIEQSYTREQKRDIKLGKNCSSNGRDICRRGRWEREGRKRGKKLGLGWSYGG